MNWKRVRAGVKVPDVFIMNLDFSDFSRLERSSHPKEFQVKIRKLHERIENLFKEDERFCHNWSGDGLVVLFRDKDYYADELLKKGKKIIALLRTKKMRLQFSSPLGVRIGITIGNIVFQKDLGKITGSPMNLAGHLQKHCPSSGGLLLRKKAGGHIKNRRLLEGFSVKTVYIRGHEHVCYFYPLDPDASVPDQLGHADSVILNLAELFGEKAVIGEKSAYTANALKRIGRSREVILTGAAPIWLYLLVARELHGKVSRLVYRSPNTAEVVIFDHTQPVRK